MTRNRLGAVVLVAAVALTSLAGCAGSGGSSSGTPTLADIKSPIQLLRNEVANRIPKDAIDGAIESDDTAVSCKSADEDPQQKYLTWQSNVVVNIKLEQSDQLSDMRSTLITSFRDQGWTQGIAASPAFVRIKKTSSIATIDVGVVKANTKLKIDGQLSVRVSGPCVLTDGPDSDEVTKLEAGS